MMTTNYTHILNENLDQIPGFDFPSDMVEFDDGTLMTWDEIWAEEEEENVDTFEIISNSQSQTGYDIPDDIFYGNIGFSMGWQFEARNVSDKRFPVGEILYFSVTFINGMPEEEAEFMNFYAHDLGWELTGRVIFRGYYHEHYDFVERDNYYTDATPEEIERARKGV